ncbi:ferritin-like [Macrobrachium rosenbergii]|uniref:ferritin-like n=1 Tax=Macrobrachium rosenbergii TaxID=79674 RepID=UPI0034D3D4B1
MASLIRQNYHEDCEAVINKNINLHLHTSYVYLSMSYHFHRADIALPGLHKFFKESSAREKEHAEKLMQYQNKRGGRVVFQPVPAPPKRDWGTAMEALQSALDIEKQLNQAFLDILKEAEGKGDPHLDEFIEEEFLEGKVEVIEKLGHMTMQLKRAGPTGLGEYLFDKDQ